uniref:Uncharacterized protein n=1 Tax=Myotis myotis TaxID=51298 RepID=A0A7J7XHK0_MYOMY|nr:hypothetical protein mMyoMyo1_011729 [Myotis myotis]
MCCHPGPGRVQPGSQGQEGWEERRGEAGPPTLAQTDPSPSGPGHIPKPPAKPCEVPSPLGGAWPAVRAQAGCTKTLPCVSTAPGTFRGHCLCFLWLLSQMTTNLGVLKLHIHSLTVWGPTPAVGRTGASGGPRGEPFPASSSS